ncbi:LOW QUALITY PROTEIN: hypothetical protein ACHAWF_013388 [Thalassiosira exigua]
MDTWMVYLPISFQVCRETDADSDRHYLLKVDSLFYGLKKGSHNWYQKLKQELEDRGFKFSKVDSCIYLQKGLVVLVTYVDDCIIISETIGDINKLIPSLKYGDEDFILTDKGSIDNLGLENNAFNAITNSKLTPVDKPLLNKYSKVKPRKRQWTYLTVVGMLTYLQENSRQEILRAVHKTGGSVTRQCFATKGNNSKGLECYVDTYFSGGWSQADANDADNIISRTVFIIMYANCPIYWQTANTIALSTAEADYMALS